MTDAAAFKELKDKVTEHDKELHLFRQQMDQYEKRIERAFQAVAKAEGESKAETENLRRAINRLFDRMGAVESSVSEIRGGISMMKWLIPLTIVLVGGVSTFVLTLVLSGGAA